MITCWNRVDLLAVLCLIIFLCVLSLSNIVVKLGWPVVLTAVIIHNYSYIMIQGLTFQSGAGVSTLSSVV